jgi:hypothetical protein
MTPVFLKRHVRRKDGKEHVYYSLCESIRLSRDRTIQRRVLNLWELNTTQIERWQRSIEVIEQEGQTRQYRLFTDREGAAPAEAADVCEVVLSSLSVRRPREFGACWLASRLWQELKLDQFFAFSRVQSRNGTQRIQIIYVDGVQFGDGRLHIPRLSKRDCKERQARFPQPPRWLLAALPAHQRFVEGYSNTAARREATGKREEKSIQGTTIRQTSCVQ